MQCKLHLIFPFPSVFSFPLALVNNCISFKMFLLIFNKSSCMKHLMSTALPQYRMNLFS